MNGKKKSLQVLISRFKLCACLCKRSNFVSWPVKYDASFLEDVFVCELCA